MTIAVISTVHARSDTRIRIKECSAIRNGGFSPVRLYVQDGQGGASFEGIDVIDTGEKPRGRLRRATQGSWRMFCAVRTARPTVAHFHDPELIPVGLALKLSGIKVIYDVHEDLPRQILTKYWIPKILRVPVALCAAIAEWIGARVFDAVVPATPKIAERFPAHKTVLVQNFPILDELFVLEGVPYTERTNAFAYVGGITRERGVMEFLDALGHLPESRGASLEMAGAFNPKVLEQEASASDGWSRVHFHGWSDRGSVKGLLGAVRAGLVLFHPCPNHVDAQPNKMFEYMAAGLPVIASDFPLWREIIEGAGCGLLVDPLNPHAIAEAMQWILDNPSEAEAMGQRGRQAVVDRYNWESESKKLIKLYERLLGARKATEEVL